MQQIELFVSPEYPNKPRGTLILPTYLLSVDVEPYLLSYTYDIAFRRRCRSRLCCRRLRRRRLRRRHDRRFRCYCCCFLVDCCLPPLLPLFPSAAAVLACPRRCHRCCLPAPLPPLLSAGAIANVAATATAAPVPSAVIAASDAYFSAAVTTASMFQRFRLPLCYNVSAAAAAAASVSIAIATIVSAKTITDKKC